MSPELALAGVIGAALCLYFLFGGADFGGGAGWFAGFLAGLFAA